jgi:hypothetical protein
VTCIWVCIVCRSQLRNREQLKSFSHRIAQPRNRAAGIQRASKVMTWCRSGKRKDQRVDEEEKSEAKQLSAADLLLSTYYLLLASYYLLLTTHYLLLTTHYLLLTTHFSTL